MLGLSVWLGIFRHNGWANPLEGVAVAFWAALSLLCIIGVRYPLKMLPLIFLQFTYNKLIWLLAVALPRLSTGAPTWYMKPMLMGALLEPLLIPWPYVFATYITKAGDRWRNRSLAPEETLAGELPSRQNWTLITSVFASRIQTPFAPRVHAFVRAAS